MKQHVLLYLICEKVKIHISSDFNVILIDFYTFFPFKSMYNIVYFLI
jgi:hypothetical protein